MSTQAQDLRPRSLLELISTQQTGHGPGIRLEFREDLLASVTLDRWPYHYCAVHGLTDLAVHLYATGVQERPPICIAAFRSQGLQGKTPWQKTLSFSPSEVACLAGHEETAEILRLIQQGVPIHWTRGSHHAFPSAYKAQVRLLVEGCISCPAFYTLPRPAQQAVLEDVATSLARTTVWRHVDKSLWNGCHPDSIPHDQVEAAAALTREVEVSGNAAQDVPNLAYQFRLAAGPLRRGCAFGPLLRCGVGLACMATSRALLGFRGLVANSIALLTGMAAPGATLSVLMGLAIQVAIDQGLQQRGVSSDNVV
ncbi:hypothetical protein WJX72_000264 [[Myrmecia] bisecta]|uniref:Uncharacterized protein n=1 Tax=[Myrmecia] bisecta TaxID=41462 RepID=A0AAW1QPD3_9CHLO